MELQDLIVARGYGIFAQDCIPSRSWNKDLTRGELMAGKGYTVSLHGFIRGWFYGFNKHSL